MKIISRWGGAVLMALCLLSCDEESKDVTDVAFFITPKGSEAPVIKAGEVQRYEMELHTTHDYINRIQVTSFNSIEGKRVLTDSSLTMRLDKFIFDYRAPFLSRDSVYVTLTFEAWDNTGSYGVADRQLLVVSNGGILLPEKSGIVLRSSDSGFADALSFSDPSKTFRWKNTADSIRADLYLDADATFSLLGFASNTKAKMVRINSFDYAAATALSIQSVYESSRLDNRIDDLAINDIILVGHESRAEGVILITNIIRTGSDSERSVQLSFKGFQKQNIVW